MEPIDDDIAARSAGFLEKQVKAGKPVFLWVNFTHMHSRTHTKPESLGQTGRWLGPYADTMVDHDKNVGTVLAKLKELGIEEDTLVFYSTDNGPHMNSWPDDAFPQRKELELGRRLSGASDGSLAGEDQAGSVSNDIVAHLDWLPTLLAMAGAPDIKEKLLNGYRAGDTTYKVHLDGYNLPYLTSVGEAAAAKRRLIRRD